MYYLVSSKKNSKRYSGRQGDKTMFQLTNNDIKAIGEDRYAKKNMPLILTALVFILIALLMFTGVNYSNQEVEYQVVNGENKITVQYDEYNNLVINDVVYTEVARYPELNHISAMGWMFALFGVGLILYLLFNSSRQGIKFLEEYKNKE